MRIIKYGDDIPGVDWRKIDRGVQGCWVWAGKVRGTGQPAHMHRILLEAATGESYHKSRLLCEEPRCVNPEHREWYGVLKRDPYWVCKAPNCVKPVSSRGLCSTHDTRDRRGQGSEPPEYPGETSKWCGWESCHRPEKNKGLCSVHYRRQLRGEDMDAPIRAGYGDRTCSVEGCGRPLEARKMCSAHYQRSVSGRPLHDPIPERSKPLSAGDTYLNEEGYRVVILEDPDTGRRSRIREHRLVMEGVIGRKLSREETVHHINGVRDDNRIENLELWSSSHPPG